VAITGQPMPYLITVRNEGTAAAENVVLEDLLNKTLIDCGTLTTVPAQGSCSTDCDTGLTTCDLGTIPAGSAVAVELSVVVTTLTGIQGRFENRASVYASNPETDLTNNQTSIISDVRYNDLALTAACPAPLTGGTETTLALDYNVLGGLGASDVLITNTLSPGLTFVNYDLGALAPYADGHIEIQVLTAEDGGEQGQAGVLTSSTPDIDPSNNTAACQFSVAPFANAINFQPNGAEVPLGFLPDTGQPYNSALGYGWNTYLETRDRDMMEPQEMDTFAFSQDPAVWEYQLPNGEYRITLTVGDPAYNQGPQRVVIEDVVAVDNETTAPGSSISRTVVTQIEDGMLTVGIGSGTGHTVLDYLTIELLSTADQTEPTPPPDDPGSELPIKKRKGKP
jgi:hypothetical protein